jgi:hypothetical protein
MKKLLWLLLLGGCVSSTSAPAAKPDDAKPEAKVEIQAENAEWQRITEELLKGKSVGEQQALLESERRYQLALAWYNKGDFDKAREQAQLAVQSCGEHLAARKLLNDINSIIVGGSPSALSIPEHDVRVAYVRVEQAQLEITNHLLHGARFLDARMYTSALRELENAEFKIRNLPYDVKSLNDLLPKLRSMIARAKSSIRN